jgi:hypothetical protein
VLAARLRVDPANYGGETGMKPDGVVAVTLGVATLVSGAGGGVVVVIVCSLGCCATGSPTCSGSTELTSPKITPSAPMATTALTPIVADPDFHCFACTLTPPIRHAPTFSGRSS